MKYIKSYRSLFLLLLSGIIATQMLNAQSFYASTNAREAVVGSYFDVIFTFENIKGGDFNAPAFKKDFVQVGGPSRSSSTTMINGDVTHTQKIIYRLKPRRVGTFTIAPATLAINGKELKTEPLTIRVVEGSADAGEAPELFIRAEPSTTVAYVGQQVLLDYKLYTTVNVERSSILEESEYQGFYVQEIRRYDSGGMQEVIDGVQYVVKTIRRVSLFPQQTGTLTVTPFSLQLGVPADGSNSRPGFFFSRELRQVPTSTEPVDIKVMPLPENAPPSFTGAVGKYQQIVSLNRRTLTTDDALTMKVQIVGDGDIKRVQQPQFELPESFVVYDPKVLEEVTYEANGATLGRKVFEYLIVPEEKGTFQFEPAFTYFDPDSARYVTIREQSYEIVVRPGSQSGTDNSALDNMAGIDSDIGYLKLDTHLYRPAPPFYETAIFWGMLCLPFLMLGGFWAYQRWKSRQANVDPALMKSKKARREAARRLSTAEKHLKENNSRAFYDEISKAFLGYVCDRLHIPRSSLTKEGLRQKLQELELSSSLVEDVMDIIQTSEVALFAGQGHHEAMQTIYEKSLQALSEMEASIK